MEAYIYKISTHLSDKFYIGCTSDSLEVRFKSHYYRSRFNKYRSKLYNSINKYGFKNFKIELIEQCLVYEMFDREVYYIALFDTYYNGLNNTKGGEGCLGYKHTEETIKLLSSIPNHMTDKNYTEIYSENSDKEIEKRRAGGLNYWSSLSETEKYERCLKNRNRKSKYSVELITEIKSLLHLYTNKQLKDLYPTVNISLFSDLRSGRKWSHI